MLKTDLTAQVIMLPQNKEGYAIGDIVKRTKVDTLYPDEHVGWLCIAQSSFENHCDFQAQHIYIVSKTEPINNLDWVYNPTNKIVGKFSNLSLNNNIENYYRVLATTNSIMKLPKIPEDFIKYYVELNGAVKTVNTQACVTGNMTYINSRINEIVINSPFASAQKNRIINEFTQEIEQACNDIPQHWMQTVNFDFTPPQPSMDRLMEFFANGDFDPKKKYYACYKFGYEIAKEENYDMLNDQNLENQIAKICERNVPQVAAQLILEVIKKKNITKLN